MLNSSLTGSHISPLILLVCLFILSIPWLPFKGNTGSILQIVVVQSLSCVWLFVTAWTAACHASLSFTISPSFLKLMSVESMMPPKHLIICHFLLLLSSIFPASGSFPMSQFFASGSQSIEASASVLPMNIQS